VFWSSLNADCVKEQTQWSNSLEYVAGTFVWTLHDYIGEPGGWPHVSSSFGSFDVAGFPKAPVWWYRSWWLANVPTTDPGRPGLRIAPTGAVDPTSTFCHVVETPQAAKGKSTRTVHVYTNAPFVRFSSNSTAVPVPELGYATFIVPTTPAPTPPSPPTLHTSTEKTPPSAAHSLVQWQADALAADGSTVLSTGTATESGPAAAIHLQLDAPTERTGTGSALFLDGRDVALVRASIVDGSGTVVHSSIMDVSFTVTSGPGLLIASANGNPADHVPMHQPTRACYHGLARAVVRAAVDAVGTTEERALRKLVNADAGGRAFGSADALSASILTSDAADAPIVVMACAPGLPCTKLSIATSVRPEDSPMEVAARSVPLADIGA
jgi:hypothetical protein